MGNQKVKWTSEEEEALLAGIAKHGAGRWKNILSDPDFCLVLINPSNIDLKRESSKSSEARVKQLQKDLSAAKKEVSKVESSMSEALAAKNAEIEALVTVFPDEQVRISLVKRIVTIHRRTAPERCNMISFVELAGSPSTDKDDSRNHDMESLSASIHCCSLTRNGA